MPEYCATAVNDVSSGLGAWRMWTMLASNDIKQRCCRSALYCGQMLRQTGGNNRGRRR